MRAREFYLQQVDEAYEKYHALQERIYRIEERAVAKHGNNMVEHMLETAEEYWMYRTLCNRRSIQLAIIDVNAKMASLAKP